MNVFTRWLNGLPSKRFLREATKEVVQTPDLYKLERSKYNLMFEYGELMDGLPSHGLITKFPLWHAYTVETFSVWKKNDSVVPQPLALKINFEDPNIAMRAFKAKVRGELYKCTTADLLELDKYRSAGVQFDRRKVNIVLPITDEDGHPKRCNAWMYVGKAKFWEKPMIKDLEFSKVHRGGPYGEFSIVKTYDDNRRPWIGRYYHFTPNEFERPYEIGDSIKAAAK